MFLRLLSLLIAAAGLASCAVRLGVRQVDLDAWVGQPVAALETHPFFVAIPLVKTVASDGTEIWNFVNGANVGRCSAGGTVWGTQLSYAAYTQFANCVQRFGACNNIFYISEGRVLRYTPVGTGGVRCYTTEQLRPAYRGPMNVR